MISCGTQPPRMRNCHGIGLSPLTNRHLTCEWHCASYLSQFGVRTFWGRPGISNKYRFTSWWFQSTPLKNISQIGLFPQIGVKIKNIWNHHPDTYMYIYFLLFPTVTGRSHGLGHHPLKNYFRMALKPSEICSCYLRFFRLQTVSPASHHKKNGSFWMMINPYY